MRHTCVALMVVAPWLAHADCGAPANDTERAQCVGADLRQSDIAINDTYAQLKSQLDAQGQSDLRHAEIAWIKERAATCQVDTREPDRDKWIAALLHDYSKTVCVVRFTERRVAELKAQEAALMQPAPANPPTPLPLKPGIGAIQASPGGDVYELMSQKTPSTGRWYFEVVINTGAIASEASAAIFAGVQGLGFSTVGTLQTIHKRNAGQPPVNIGIALDLNAGKLYIRENGAWRDAPGSAGGLDLKLGRPYVAKLTSSVPLGAYLDRGWVDVDFGQHAFSYALPDGYVALDTAPPRRLQE